MRLDLRLWGSQNSPFCVGIEKKKWVLVSPPGLSHTWKGGAAETSASGATSSEGRLRRQFGSKLLILRTWMALLILRWWSTLTTFKDSKSSCKTKQKNWDGLEQEHLLRKISENSSKNRRAPPIGLEGSSGFSKFLFGNRTLFPVLNKIFSRTPIY